MSEEHGHVKLKEYIERILDEREKQLNSTARTLELRLDHLNELRSEVSKDRNMFITREIFGQMQNELTRRLTDIEKSISRIIGVGITLVVFAGVFGALIARLFK